VKNTKAAKCLAVAGAVLFIIGVSGIGFLPALSLGPPSYTLAIEVTHSNPLNPTLVKGYTHDPNTGENWAVAIANSQELWLVPYAYQNPSNLSDIWWGYNWMPSTSPAWIWYGSINTIENQTLPAGNYTVYLGQAQLSPANDAVWITQKGQGIAVDLNGNTFVTFDGQGNSLQTPFQLTSSPYNVVTVLGGILVAVALVVAKKS
jgi:hypothetical protein